MKHYIINIIAFLSLNISFCQSPANDYTPLFDGKTLDGWTASTENANSFSVKEGTIVCRGGRAHLFYTGDVGKANFKNFELKLSARTTKGSNSGVYFHTKYQEEGWPEIGFEAQVNSTHSDPIKTGSLWGVANIYAPQADTEPAIVKVNKNKEIHCYRPFAPSVDGEWFDYHIIVQDNRIIIKVNGKITVDWEQAEDWSSKRRIGEGTIGFQAHDPDSEVHYKDIRIRILD